MSERCERMDAPFELKMKTLDTLKVYGAFRNFRTYMYLIINKMPHWVKNSEGKECITDIKQCVMSLSVLSRSHDVTEKIQAINVFLAHLDCIYDSINFFTDQPVRAMSEHQSAHALLLMDEIERQLARLRKFLSDGGQIQKD